MYELLKYCNSISVKKCMNYLNSLPELFAKIKYNIIEVEYNSTRELPPIINCIAPTWYPTLLKRGQRFKSADDFYISCGKCHLCIAKYRRQWSSRAFLESQLYGNNVSFVTCTYSPYHYERVKGLPCKRDSDLFLKRLREDLRKNYGGRKLRQIGVSEYGTKTGRIHFHYIIYGISPTERELIEKHWPNGFIDIKDVTVERCAYVCKYAIKGVSREFRRLSPHFFTKSQSIGLQYIRDNIVQLLKQSLQLKNVVKKGFLAVPITLVKRVVKEGDQSLKDSYDKVFNSIVEKMKKEKLEQMRKNSWSFNDFLEKHRESLFQKIRNMQKREELYG